MGKNIIKDVIKKYAYLVIMMVSLFIYDVFNRYVMFINVERLDGWGFLESTPILFDVFWISLIISISLLLKGKLKKIYIVIVNSILMIFSVINYIFLSIFGTTLSAKDLVFVGEGISFGGLFVRTMILKVILIVVVFIIMVLILIKMLPRERDKTDKYILIALLILMCTSYINVKKDLKDVDDNWATDVAYGEKSNYYNSFFDTNKSMMVSGFFEYIVRDSYLSFFSKDNVKKAYNNIKSYYEDNEVYVNDNEYTGMFKDKNLILIQMECIDTWMINEKTTPTIYNMMNSGINFKNFYSPIYMTGATFSAEFVANTGIYPNMDAISPAYNYVNNDYKFSLPSLFKQNEYIVNSYHRTNGWIYNRDNIHKSLGYENYYNHIDMNVESEELDLDSKLIEYGYERIISDDKFMSFIITYSAHMPFDYDKEEVKKNIDKIRKEFPDIADETYLAAMSQARETDNMFKELLQRLQEDGRLDDTVIIAYTDHYAYEVEYSDMVKVQKNEDDINLLTNVPFFIWTNDIEKKEIDKVASVADILPTILNLFELSKEYYYAGNDALSEGIGYVVFKDLSWFDGEIYSKVAVLEENNVEYIKEMNKRSYEIIRLSKDILICDYYNVHKNR